MQSEICKFYNGTKVFITGGSGFLGRVLIEKLLRSTNVSKIYILLRPKRNKNIETRTEEILNSILFQKLKNRNTNFRDRVIPINGDCSMDELGLSLEDRQKLRENINIVFHSAATVRFNENLKHSFNINAGGTKAVLSLSKQMKNLKSVVHVSTAYSHCYRNTIDETFYDCPQKYEEIEAKLKDLSLTEAEKLTPKFIEKWPNTYTFTKALAESYVRNNGGTLPIAIFRPSGVISTFREPLEGWTDTSSGALTLYTAFYLGNLRVFQADSKRVADLVPVDTCVSALIASAWDNHQQRKEKNIPIYNYVSYPENPITWGEYVKFNAPYTIKYPSNSLIWTPCEAFLVKNYFLALFLKFFISYLPAIIIDTVAVVSGRKPQLLKICSKTDKQMSVFNYFVMREWKFKNENVIGLWNKMNEIDKELFPFSISTFKWTDYFENFVKGIRTYLLKEPLDNLDSAKFKLKSYSWFNIQFDHDTKMTENSELKVLQGNNQFTNNLYKILAEQDGNVFFSPLSTHVVLSIAYQGVQGTTAERFADILKICEAETAAEGYNAVKKRLNSVKKVTLLMANKLYLMDGNTLMENFKSAITKHFLSDVQLVAFRQNKVAAKIINDWINEKTHGKIKNVINKNELNDLTKLVLVNTIYFKGNWKHQFENSLTETESFYLNDNDKTDVQMMHIKKEFNYKNDDHLEVQILELSYISKDFMLGIKDWCIIFSIIK